MSSCHPPPWSAGIFKDSTHLIRQSPLRHWEEPPALLHIHTAPDCASLISSLESVSCPKWCSYLCWSPENVSSDLNDWARLALGTGSPEHHRCLHACLQPAGTPLRARLPQNTPVLAAKQRQSLEKETHKWASRCVHTQRSPSAQRRPAKLPAGQGSAGSGADAGGAAGSPTARAGAVRRLQRPRQRFLSTPTPREWAPASLAWSISNPNGSALVWKPIWASFYRDIRHDDSTVGRQRRRKRAKFCKCGHGLKLVLAGKKQTVTFLISPAQSTSFCKMSWPDIYPGRGRDDLIFDGSWQEGSQGGWAATCL